MRDHGRINEVLNVVGQLWKRHPDMRLCQLLHCITGKDDMFHVEDDKLLELLESGSFKQAEHPSVYVRLAEIEKLIAKLQEKIIMLQSQMYNKKDRVDPWINDSPWKPLEPWPPYRMWCETSDNSDTRKAKGPAKPINGLTNRVWW